MTTRRLYGLYAQEVHGKQVKGFLRIISYYGYAELYTLDNNGKEESCEINYQQMIYWIARKIKEIKKI